MDAVIGAGMGGLAAAIRLARSGRTVHLFEATEQAGGLAGRVNVAGLAMDGGPYILLDRPGLEWAFEELGETLTDHVDLLPLDEAWRVSWPDGQDIRIYRSLDQTARELDQAFPGTGARYRTFVGNMLAQYERLATFQRSKPPRPLDMLRPSRLRSVPFLLRSLGHHLGAAGFPDRVQQALGIWTHIASQPLSKAPAPMAFVPAIVHSRGAFVAKGGIHRIGEALLAVAQDAGVTVHLGTKVDRILREGDDVTAIEVNGERLSVGNVISNAPGISTLTQLIDPPEASLTRDLEKLPLQSPGVAAYMTGDAAPDVPFLRFMLKPNEPCRLFIRFDGIDPSRPRQLRLLGPVDYDWASRVGPEGQTAYLNQVLEEDWWRAGISNVEVHETRIPEQWGRRHLLYRNSMNPVMTAAFMRRGRLPHHSPLADNLYLAGAATHPGQWVSFAAISGILAADRLIARA